MSSVSSGEACCRLADELEQHWSADEELNTKHKQVIVRLRSIGGGEPGATDISTFIPHFAGHFEQILVKGRPAEFKTAILGTLATVTREIPFWRPLFGLECKPEHRANVKQMKGDVPPDSILEVARRVISGTIQVSSSEQMRAALRIIANTCADNNINRSVMVNRDGIESLVALLMKNRESDLVIPVLYNVCLDYDEPATDAEGKIWELPQMQGANSVSPLPTLSATEQRLGTCWFPHENKTSFEILLSARQNANSSAGTIADLVEMASRVAWHGIAHFVREDGRSASSDIIETDTTHGIIGRLLVEGAELAAEDIECRVSICQAVLNVLSQPETHITVAQDSNLLYNLIYLPYPRRTDKEDWDEEEQDALKPYRKEILKLVYKVTATDTYAQAFSPLSPAAPELLTTLKILLADQPARGPLASICVLLANSVTTMERAEQLLQSGEVAWMLEAVLVDICDPDILLPALDLATRLALSPKGQDAFSTDKVNIFFAMAKVLRDRTSDVDATGLEIQRNVVALARLLIKGRYKNIQQLISSPSGKVLENGVRSGTDHLVGKIYNLWDRTTDSQTRIEIGKLFIETLRTIYSTSRLSIAEDTSTSTHENHAKEGRTTSETAESSLLNLLGNLDQSRTASATPPPFRSTVAEAIAHIIVTNSQPQPQPQSQLHQPPSSPNLIAEAEGWFGLALLSTVSTAAPSVTTAFARNDFQLLNRLREIVKEKNPSPYPSSPSSSKVLNQGHAQDGETGHVNKQALFRSRPHPATAPVVPKDPRYENVKVLVVKMLQIYSAADVHDLPADSQPTNQDRQVVQAGLEAAAAEMGLDWVIL